MKRKYYFRVNYLRLKLVLAAGILFITWAWSASAPRVKFKSGDAAPIALNLQSIQGLDVRIPSEKSKWTHLQFRRFAGCPICNLHLQDFVKRHAEIHLAGIQEVVVFHSPKESLIPFQGKFPFDVIGDPGKRLYDQFGVGSSIFSLLDVRVWPSILDSTSVKDKPTGEPEGGPLGLPADFLVSSDGKIAASHYGKHAFDQWSVDELLALVQ